MSRFKSLVPALLVTVGTMAFLFWASTVLPLLSLGLEPVPGMAVEALEMAFILPAVASALILGGALLGVHRRRLRGISLGSPGSLAYAALGLLGCIAAAYTSYLIYLVQP